MTEAINKTILAMMDYYRGDAKRISHFLKVHSYAKLIGELENGEVKINGVIWTAMKMEDATEIQKDAVVEVVAVNGNKLVVKEYIH